LEPPLLAALSVYFTDKKENSNDRIHGEAYSLRRIASHLRD
jgi:hypothetical protein